ncbi:hypothetical protein PILCRDRAFT_719225 [Piloderma croceum F 1598]|uniref:Amine oxidase domain-containing protein n=1 Tax=Piloderma croceum (strain F 1598) TaxID=765440 RepID=A0A0C3EMD2_PILCF|nr:hypothetical protein PILCRDRAFT_719225 [Piloderma croceum F 1598]
MVRPTCTMAGGPVAKLEVPPKWSTKITVVSRQVYYQIARVTYPGKSHYFMSGWGQASETMVDVTIRSDNITITSQSIPLTVDFTFFHTKDLARSRKTFDNWLSHKLTITTQSQPAEVSNDCVIFSLAVQDVPGQPPGGGQVEDIVATIVLVSDEAPPAEETPLASNATFEGARQSVDNFQANSGIPEEDLTPGPAYIPPPHLAALPVGIIGAGAAGLYTAMILDSLGIKYEILEASGRHGGRLYTYQFTKQQGPYQYYDVGAMRYPDVIFMKRTFDLVRNKLKIGHKLIPYIGANDKSFLHFNGRRVTKAAYKLSDQGGISTADTFRVGITANNRGGYVPEQYLVQGHEALFAQALAPLRQYFVDLPFPEAFQKLMIHDAYTVRDYLAMHWKYPNAVVRWIETMEWRTAMFDASLTETVLASLVFSDPRSRSEGKDINWFCFDGGSCVLSDAMLNAILTKPKYHQRVTSIKDVAEDSNQTLSVVIDRSGDPNLSNNTETTKKYSNIISTLPLSVLRTVDLDDVYLSTSQRAALRELLYTPSIKVGIQFKSAWWEQLDIIGGQSYTDRPVRVIVYPSYGPGPRKSNVLIASYNGMQDSQRLGALMRGRGTSEEKTLLNLIMKDLAAVHNLPIDNLWKEYIDYHPWDWYGDSNTLGEHIPDISRYRLTLECMF